MRIQFLENLSMVHLEKPKISLSGKKKRKKKESNYKKHVRNVLRDSNSLEEFREKMFPSGELRIEITPLLKKYGFVDEKSVKKHMKREDKTGRTRGCGCPICILRNDIYKLRLTKSSYIQAMSKLSSLERFVLNYNGDIFSYMNDTGDVEIFYRLGWFPLFKKKGVRASAGGKEKNYNTIMITADKDRAMVNINKTLKSIDKKLKEIEGREENYVMALYKLRNGLKL